MVSAALTERRRSARVASSSSSSAATAATKATSKAKRSESGSDIASEQSSSEDEDSGDDYAEPKAMKGRGGGRGRKSVRFSVPAKAHAAGSDVDDEDDTDSDGEDGGKTGKSGKATGKRKAGTAARGGRGGRGGAKSVTAGGGRRKPVAGIRSDLAHFFVLPSSATEGEDGTTEDTEDTEDATQVAAQALGLVTALIEDSSAIETLGSDWLELYNTDHNQALAQLVNLVVCSSGYCVALKPEAISHCIRAAQNDDDEDDDESKISEEVVLLRQLELHDKTFVGAARGISIQRDDDDDNDNDSDGNKIQLSSDMILGRSRSSKKFKSNCASFIRHIVIQAKFTELASSANNMYDTAINASDWFYSHVFERRHRDVDPLIRIETIHSLATWLLLRPEMYVDAQHLSKFTDYFSDKDANVRSNTLNALSGVFDPSLAATQRRIQQSSTANSALRQYAMRHCNRFVQMAVMDIDDNVRGGALVLLTSMTKRDMLPSGNIPNSDMFATNIWNEANKLDEDEYSVSVPVEYRVLTAMSPLIFHRVNKIRQQAASVIGWWLRNSWLNSVTSALVDIGGKNKSISKEVKVRAVQRVFASFVARHLVARSANSAPHIESTATTAGVGDGDGDTEQNDTASVLELASSGASDPLDSEIECVSVALSALSKELPELLNVDVMLSYLARDGTGSSKSLKRKDGSSADGDMDASQLDERWLEEEDDEQDGNDSKSTESSDNGLLNSQRLLQRPQSDREIQQRMRRKFASQIDADEDGIESESESGDSKRKSSDSGSTIAAAEKLTEREENVLLAALEPAIKLSRALVATTKAGNAGGDEDGGDDDDDEQSDSAEVDNRDAEDRAIAFTGRLVDSFPSLLARHATSPIRSRLLLKLMSSSVAFPGGRSKVRSVAVLRSLDEIVEKLISTINQSSIVGKAELERSKAALSLVPLTTSSKQSRSRSRRGDMDVDDRDDRLDTSSCEVDYSCHSVLYDASSALAHISGGGDDAATVAANDVVISLRTLIGQLISTGEKARAGSLATVTFDSQTLPELINAIARVYAVLLFVDCSEAIFSKSAFVSKDAEDNTMDIDEDGSAAQYQSTRQQKSTYDHLMDIISRAVVHSEEESPLVIFAIRTAFQALNRHALQLDESLNGLAVDNDNGDEDANSDAVFAKLDTLGESITNARDQLLGYCLQYCTNKHGTISPLVSHEAFSTMSQIVLLFSGSLVRGSEQHQHQQPEMSKKYIERVNGIRSSLHVKISGNALNDLHEYVCEVLTQTDAAIRNEHERRQLIPAKTAAAIDQDTSDVGDESAEDDDDDDEEEDNAQSANTAGRKSAIKRKAATKRGKGAVSAASATLKKARIAPATAAEPSYDDASPLPMALQKQITTAINVAIGYARCLVMSSSFDMTRFFPRSLLWRYSSASTLPPFAKEYADLLHNAVSSIVEHRLKLMLSSSLNATLEAHTLPSGDNSIAAAVQSDEKKSELKRIAELKKSAIDVMQIALRESFESWLVTAPPPPSTEIDAGADIINSPADSSLPVYLSSIIRTTLAAAPRNGSLLLSTTLSIGLHRELIVYAISKAAGYLALDDASGIGAGMRWFIHPQHAKGLLQYLQKVQADHQLFRAKSDESEKIADDTDDSGEENTAKDKLDGNEGDAEQGDRLDELSECLGGDVQGAYTSYVARLKKLAGLQPSALFVGKGLGATAAATPKKSKTGSAAASGAIALTPSSAIASGAKSKTAALKVTKKNPVRQPKKKTTATATAAASESEDELVDEDDSAASEDEVIPETPTRNTKRAAAAAAARPRPRRAIAAASKASDNDDDDNDDDEQETSDQDVEVAEPSSPVVTRRRGKRRRQSDVDTAGAEPAATTDNEIESTSEPARAVATPKRRRRAR
ncbi:hypothetical protein GQ42DRAFT_158715 [Ramicandelaber brevisporus]|nr:hypothetical protein GQ42DRAFT_158715 [Ramicandelaber brevisporus]